MSRLTGIVATAAAMVVFVFAVPAQAGIFGLSRPATPPALRKKLHKPVSRQLMATLGRATEAGLDLGKTPANAHLKIISGPHPNPGGKVGFLYIGAEFCPYCAGQRWGLVLTLMRFGKFSGLQYMLSSPSDVYPNTSTVTFQHATYKSPYVALQAVEIEDRHHHALMSLDPLQKKILTTFDAPPHVRYPGSIPFVYVGGQYMLNQPMLMPQQINKENWQQIADTLANPKSILFRRVMPRVNLMTAAICHLDGGKPSAVCTSPGVVAANGELMELSPAKH